MTYDLLSQSPSSQFQMGNKPNQYNQQGHATLPEKSLEHRHLGQIECVSHPHFGACFLKVHHFADQMMSHEKLRRLQARIKKYSNSDSVVSVWGVELKDKQEMCAHNSELHVYFEKYSDTLRTVLDGRLKERKNFSESEIMQFLKMCVGTLVFLQDNGFKNSQLDKDSILMCSGKLKVLDLAIAASSPYDTYINTGVAQDGCYYSPEILKDLKERNFEPFLSPKSDVFSLGMLTLEMACLEPLDNYYDYESFSIDYQSLIHRVSRIVYSTELKTLIAGMLEYEADMRLGLISLQEKINKILNVSSEGDPTDMKRSRSSSTKMLKQLLTSSRKSLLASDKNTNTQTMVRKNSSASLTSMASLNSRNSLTKQLNQKKQIGRKPVLLPEAGEANQLRNMVRNKLSIQQKEEPSGVQTKTNLVYNKENTSFNQFCSSKNSLIENVKMVHDTRRSSYHPNTFFDVPCYFPRDTTTPKAPEPFFRREKKQEESIFRMIENDPRYNSNCSDKAKESTIQKIDRHEKGLDGMPINAQTRSPSAMLKVERVQETSSIHKPEQTHEDVREFDETDRNLLSPPVESISLRGKNSLHNMYKTTQSINSSGQKSFLVSAKKDMYKKIFLPNGFIYEGEIIGADIFEGNGILYAPNQSVVYNGSWVSGRYDGFGTLYNLHVTNGKVDKNDLASCESSWVKYEGQFKRGDREGFGTIYFANGEKFSGCMKNGEVSGYGCFYDNLNHMTSGIWAANKLQV